MIGIKIGIRQELVLLIVLIGLYPRAYSQSYCPILEDEWDVVAISKVHDEYLILQATGSIWRSTDAVNWVEDEIEEFADTDSFGFAGAMTFFDESSGIVASGSNPDLSKSSLYYTEDGGLTWSRSKLMLEDGSIMGFYPYQLFTLDEQTVVMTQLFSGNFFISHNRGETWSLVDDYTQSAGATMDITFFNRDVWYLPSYTGLYKTTDQLGSTELLIDRNFIQFYASSDSPNMYGLTFETGIGFELYFSDDEFDSWNKVALSETNSEFSNISSIFEIDNILYLFEWNGLHYSTDNGVNWIKTDLENPNWYGNKLSKIEGEIYSYHSNMIRFNCLPVSVNNIKSDIDFSLYPNPTNGPISFYNPNNLDLDIVLYDCLGNKLLSSNANYSIDLSDLSNGMYLIKVVSRNLGEISVESIILNR